MSFKKHLKKLQEETTSGDIATVDNKIGLTRSKKKGKKCKKHDVVDCETCHNDSDSKWQ